MRLTKDLQLIIQFKNREVIKVVQKHFFYIGKQFLQVA